MKTCRLRSPFCAVKTLAYIWRRVPTGRKSKHVGCDCQLATPWSRRPLGFLQRFNVRALGSSSPICTVMCEKYTIALQSLSTQISAQGSMVSERVAEMPSNCPHPRRCQKSGSQGVGTGTMHEVTSGRHCKLTVLSDLAPITWRGLRVRSQYHLGIRLVRSTRSIE